MTKLQPRSMLIAIIIYALLFVAVAANASDRSIAAEIDAAASLASEATGVKKDLILAVAWVESSHRPDVVGSSHGEVGLMQLRPKYFPEASFDVYDNIMQGAQYLALLKRIRPRSDFKWVVHYNVGPNREVNTYRSHPYYLKVIKALEEKPWK